MKFRNQTAATLDRELFPVELPFSRSLRSRLFLYGVLVPVACVWLSVTNLVPTAIRSSWQSGEADVFASLLLAWPAISVFFPVMSFSSLCLGAWTIRPELGQRFWIRFGIYTGCLVSVQFTLLFLCILAFAPILGALLVLPGIALAGFCLSRVAARFQRFQIVHLMVGTLVSAIIVLLIQKVPSLFQIFPSMLLVMLVSGPVLTLAAFFRVSTAVHFQVKRAKAENSRTAIVVASLAWLPAYIVSWKFAVELMMVGYQKLPTTAPNCYVSSAAAFGHRAFVASSNNDIRSNNDLRINSQMQRLKFLEFVLQAVTPKTVKFLRRFYDNYGPKLARCCRANVWFADFTYVLLKPIEFVAIIARLILGIEPGAISKIYRISRPE